jgi:uncharacterized protein (DUF697 family)
MSTVEVTTEHKADPVREAREHQANAVVAKHVKWAAGLSLVPVPVLDLAFIIGAQVKMLSELADVYDLKFSRSTAGSLITSLIGGLGAGALAGTTTSLFAKFLPWNGLILGATSVASLAAMAAATTYAVGKIFTMHFASGGTLFTFDPKQMHQHFADLYREKLHRTTTSSTVPNPVHVTVSPVSSTSEVAAKRSSP